MSVVTLTKPNETLCQDLALLSRDLSFDYFRGWLALSADRATKRLKALEKTDDIIRQQGACLVLDKLLEYINEAKAQLGIDGGSNDPPYEGSTTKGIER